jgi:hypothetical protein
MTDISVYGVTEVTYKKKKLVRDNDGTVFFVLSVLARTGEGVTEFCLFSEEDLKLKKEVTR